MVVQVQTIHEEIAAAMLYARKRAGLTTEQMARELNRIIGRERYLTTGRVESIENGELNVTAEELVAAARIAELPVSMCLGELTIYAEAIPELERRIAALEDKLSSRPL